MILTKPYILEGHALSKDSNIQLCEKIHKYDYVYLDMSQLLSVEQNEEFHKFQTSLDSNLIYTEDNDYGIERNHHVTCFYGLLNAPNNFEKIKYLYDISKPFLGSNLRINNISFFRNDDAPYDVMKFELSSNVLSFLNKTIYDLFENECTFPEYQAHMTVAYVKKGAFSEYEGKNNFTFCNTTLPITEIVYQDVYDNKKVLHL